MSMNNSDVYVQLKNYIDTYKENYPVPTNPQNKERFLKIRQLEAENKTDTLEYKNIRNTLIVTNGAFAMKYAIIYCKMLNEIKIIDDIFQCSQFGIIEAVDRFDPSINVNFTTFAYHYVKKNIIDYIKTVKVVKAPRIMAKNIKHVNEIRNELIGLFAGKQVTCEDIQETLLLKRDIDIDLKTIDDIVVLIELSSAANEDSFITDNIDSIPIEDTDNEIYSLLTSLVEKELKIFDDDTKDLIKLRFGIGYEKPYSLSEIKFLKSLSDDDIESFKEITRISLSKEMKK